MHFPGNETILIGLYSPPFQTRQQTWQIARQIAMQNSNGGTGQHMDGSWTTGDEAPPLDTILQVQKKVRIRE